MTADDLIRLLRIRHEEDIFIPECKNGPTSVFGAQVLKFDALAFRRSWQLPCFNGYEIKVSRSDFNRDTKWMGYLDSCHLFWFVCPHGLIRPEELPPEVGLIYATKDGSGLRLQRKAAHRKISDEAVNNVYRYLLFSRAKFDGERIEDPKTRFENWIFTRRNNQSAGHKHGTKVRELIQKEISEVRSENEQLRRENANLTAVKQLLERNGLSTHWRPVERLAQLIDHYSVPFDPNVVSTLSSAARMLERTATTMEDINRQLQLSKRCADLVDGYQI